MVLAVVVAVVVAWGCALGRTHLLRFSHQQEREQQQQEAAAAAA
eukprot:COSAG06_NODE_51423_length_312_cov_0.868545_1_plen_43_part_01